MPQVAKARSRRKRTAKTERSYPIDRGEIARVAYQLWEQKGRQQGQDQENWLEAERIVWSRRSRKA